MFNWRYTLKSPATLALILGAAVAAALSASGPGNAQPGNDYVTELAQIDARIQAEASRAADRTNEWMPLERLAALSLERARLTGNYDDLAEAERLVKESFDRAPEGAGPFFTRSRLHFTLHRLDAAAADLATAARRPLLGGRERSAMAGLAGEIAFQQGRYEDARQAFTESLALNRNASNTGALALFSARITGAAEAERLLREAATLIAGDDGRTVAWIHLQLGLLDLEQDQPVAALAHYRDADAAFSGWWLIEEHIAEALNLTGRVEDARALYLDLIGRTGNPEFMDAMAGIETDAEASAGWTARAREVYESQLRRFPTAAYGHALGHFLETGADPARVLELARQNHDLRPGGDAQLLLAEAWLNAGRTVEARAAVNDLLATPWRSPDLLDLAARVGLDAGGHF